MSAGSAKPRNGEPASESMDVGIEVSQDGAGNAATGNSGLLEGSAEAKRLAAAILEVLAGARGPSEAAEVLGISLARYYQLETRALGGLLAACEPRRRKGHRGASDLAVLRKECERLRRECARQQALVRAAQRTVGLAPPPAPAPSASGTGRKRRKRRPKARAHKVAALLRAEEKTPAPESVVEDTAEGTPEAETTS